MPHNSAPQVEGLSERSITEYRPRAIAREGVRGVGGDPSMNARVRAFGTTLVIEASGGGSEFERRPLRPGLPTIDFIFVEHGEFVYLEEGAWVVSSSPLMIAPSGLPHRVRFTSDWKFVLARVHREALLPFVPMLADTVGVYSKLTVPEHAMRVFLTHLVQSDQDVSAGESYALDRQVLEMAGTLMRYRQGAAAQLGSPRTVLRDRALAYIAEQSGDARLEPARVAAEVGASLRHLQAIFAEAHTSIAAELRRERSRVARATLQDDRFDSMSIEQVAVRAGFGSSVSMRRALGEIYGLGPKELRHRRATAQPEPSAEGNIGA